MCVCRSVCLEFLSHQYEIVIIEYKILNEGTVSILYSSLLSYIDTNVTIFTGLCHYDVLYTYQ